MILSFVYYGRPESQGSMRAFTPKGWTRPILTSTNKNLKVWRAGLSIRAQEAIAEKLGKTVLCPIKAGTAVRVRLEFYFLPPKSKAKKPGFKTTRPDLDKLIRSTLDGMTGIVYEDDSQVTYITAMKYYGIKEAVQIDLETI